MLVDDAQETDEAMNFKVDCNAAGHGLQLGKMLTCNSRHTQTRDIKLSDSVLTVSTTLGAVLPGVSRHDGCDT